MRIALCPIGSEGDVRPMLALALALRRAGHEPETFASPDCAGLYEARGLPLHPVGSPLRADVARMAAKVMGRPWTGMPEMLRWTRRAAIDQFRDLSPALRGFDLVLGSGLQFAAPSIAEARSMPFLHVAHFSTLVESGAHPPPNIPRQGLPGPVNRLLWAATRLAMNLPLRGPVNTGRASLGLAPARSYDEPSRGRLWIAMDPVLSPLPPDGAGTLQTAYWRIDDETALDPATEHFLSSGDPPVYLGFGSMGDPAPGTTLELLLAAIAQAGTRAIVSRGWADYAPPGGIDPARIHFIGHAPHGLLLPRCAAAVHHGGAGTTWIATRSGIPQVIVPHLLDQFYWSRRIPNLGLGPEAIPRARLTAERLAGALRWIADRRVPLRARSAEVADALAARDGLAEAVGVIERCERAKVHAKR